MNKKEILQEIKRYAELGKLSVFVGAGVSRLSGFPSWAGLVKDMADELGYGYECYNDGHPKFSSEELLKVPQMYFLNKGEECYRNKVEDSFRGQYEPNEIHDLILSLQPNHLLTTNYDLLLEETAIKFGRNFSVLNSNSMVAIAETRNYLIKVHGDFSAEFVLKEQDYLDYEKNYILLDNVMKTIFATNLVIFVGYGLNDYNIKLILNWVKNVQSDSFVMPIFIHTGEELSGLELEYQAGRGLRVIDCNEYTDSTDYLVKYREVLNGILTFNNSSDLSKRVDKLGYLYNKISGIKNLAYIRREDFNQIFQGDYELNDRMNIVNKTITYSLSEEGNQKSSLKVNYFEDFFENETAYKQINEDFFDCIKDFIRKCGIRGIEGSVGFVNQPIEIMNPSFYSDYDKMMSQFCNLDSETLLERYERAYYMAQMGDYVASYNEYTGILKESKDSEDWDIYYLSQINRQFLFMLIKQLISYTNSFNGISFFGQRLNIFEESVIERLNFEMANHQLENQFSELPYDFKSRYRFLEDFSKRNCYIDKYYRLVKEKYEVDKALQKNTTYFGISKFDEVKLAMLETTKFMYENMILFTVFDENKLYIKNAMISWLGAYEKEMTKNDSGIFGDILNTRYEFTLTDVILISKNFTKDDISYLIKKINLKNIPFVESMELEAHINNRINFYSRNFKRNLSLKEVFNWKWNGEEIKNLLLISSYLVESNECRLNVIQFLIKTIDRNFEISEKIELIKKWFEIKIAEEVFYLVENWLIEKIEAVLTKQSVNNIRTEMLQVANLLTIIYAQGKGRCNTNNISEVIIKNLKEISGIQGLFKHIYPILNDEAKKNVDSVYKIDDVLQLIRRGYFGEDTKDYDELKIIDSYLENTVKEKNANEKSGIVVEKIPSVEDTVAEVAAYMLQKKFPETVINKYYGIWDQYDFLLNSVEFKEEVFRLEWLLRYPDDLCESLKKCSKQKSIVTKAIESLFERIDETALTQKQIMKYFRVYKIMNSGNSDI